MSRFGIGLLSVCLCTASSFGAIIIDGSKDGDYGSALAVQQPGTQFGNSTAGQVGDANGSELDGGYGTISGGNLNVLLTGNLETNFNKLEIFIDSVAGGQNKLRGDNPDVDFNGLNRMGDDGSGNGLTFDSAFSADHWLSLTGGGGSYYLNGSQLLTGGGGTGGFQGTAALGGVLTGANGVIVGWNNSNTLGVSGFGNPNDSAPSSVLTGIELQIPLSLIGSPSGPIKISAFINGGSHDFAANQWLGALPLSYGNLGEPRSINLNNAEGDQYFTVVPEPGTCGLMLLSTLFLVRRRKA